MESFTCCHVWPQNNKLTSYLTDEQYIYLIPITFWWPFEPPSHPIPAHSALLFTAITFHQNVPQSWQIAINMIFPSFPTFAFSNLVSPLFVQMMYWNPWAFNPINTALVHVTFIFLVISCSGLSSPSLLLSLGWPRPTYSPLRVERNSDWYQI